ncbi:MAG TPA: FTR1 family protein, partial [Vicinamibacteria bacterium]
LSTMPPGRPSLHRARALYSANCAICHGGKGDGDTPRARELEPRPASFRETARLAQLSPYRVYNTLTFGVPGTAMASFETLSTAERWDLAFYVFRLGHEGAAGRGPVDLTLAELASSSDAELLRLLRSGGADAEGALTFARHDAAFSEPQVGAGVGRARRLVREAASAFSAGRPDAADRHLIDAYLQGFEPEEPRLRSRDPEGTLAVEAAFRDLRAAMARDDRATALGLAWALERRLATLSEGGARVVVPFTAAFLIFFREGLEAALVVAALLAVVRKLGRSDAARYVHVGWIAALPAGLLTFWAFERFLALSAVRRELLEALVALTAAGVLFSVSFWMISKAESRHWLAYLRQNVERSLGGRRLFVLAGLAFLAVYREAAETVLFTHALLLDATAARSEVAAGAAAGVTAVALLALALNRSVLRLSLGPFFAVSGVLLCGLAMSFAGSGMYTLVAAGYLSPRPVSFPEIPWMGIHPDLSGLVVQLSIAVAIAAAGIATLRRTPDPRL